MRRGFTFVETMVSVALLAVFLAMFWNFWSSSSRQQSHIEETTTLISVATLVQEALARDLIASLDIGVLPEEQRLSEEASEWLYLPIFTDYAVGEPDALRYRVKTWHWDASKKVLLRGDRGLVRNRLKAVSFRWSKELPRVLLVTLTGEGLMGRSKDLILRMALPPTTARVRSWQPAKHHQRPHGAL
jgi:prepilin-type N-terminal cleavage/methylation domain-containing protein